MDRDTLPPTHRTFFEIRLIGPFEVVRDGARLDLALWQRRSGTLLRLLATSPSHRCLRDDVVDLFWPEADAPAAARNLRYVLYILRRDLGGGDPPPISSDHTWLALNPTYRWDIDLDRFDQLAKTGVEDERSRRDAVRLFASEPLPQDRYDDWAVSVRRRVETAWKSMALQLALDDLRAGEYAESIHWAEMALARDPLDESVVQVMLRSLLADGRRVDAVRLFNEFEQRLREEMDVAPADDTIALLSTTARVSTLNGVQPTTEAVGVAVERVPGRAGTATGEEGQLPPTYSPAPRSRKWTATSQRPYRTAVSAVLLLLLFATGLALVIRARPTPPPPMLSLVTTLPLSTSAHSQLRDVSSIAVDARGTVYLLDRNTGQLVVRSDSRERVLPLSDAHHVVTLRDPKGLAVDAAGNIYIADTGNNRIVKFSAHGHLEAAWGHAGSAPGQFRSPLGLALGPEGRIFVADTGNNRIQILSSAGESVARQELQLSTMQFALQEPVAVATDGKGGMYVADAGPNYIVHFSPETFSVDNFWTVSGVPTALAVAGDEVYVGDDADSAVWSFTLGGTLLRSWSGKETGIRTPIALTGRSTGEVFMATGGRGQVLAATSLAAWKQTPGASGSVRQAVSAEALMVDPSGVVYIADRGSDSLLRWSAGGGWTVVWTPRTGTSSVLNGPIGGIAPARDGVLYASDYGSGRVLRLSHGRVTAVWGARPVDPGMSYPQGLLLTNDGTLLIADQGNSRIVGYSSDGSLRSLWPLPAAPKSSGPPTPYAMTEGRSGTVYMTDELNDEVIELSTGGELVSRWGRRGQGAGEMRTPQGIAYDPRRAEILVADTDNNRIDAFSAVGQWLGSQAVVRPIDLSFDARRNRLYVTDRGGARLDVFSTG